MTFKNNSNFTDSKLSTIIEFTITENIEKLGIKEFVLQDKDFIITWTNGRKSCIGFKSSSISENKKLIEKILRKEVKGIVDDETLDKAVKDLEDQLIKRREEILNLNNTNTSESDYADHDFKTKFLEDVSNLREQFENSGNPYLKWKTELQKKYETLKFIANTYFPDSWQLLQFCISVKSVQNIYGNNLPFVGFILYKPSSLKSTIIDLFQKYPSAISNDDLTKGSFLSHYSTNSEEELQKNDLIPKMKDKILLTSEIAPIINTNEDDLRKILGIITRLVDGKGYQSHSGTHGHRGYPPMMFTWIGAGIEIPPKMWIMLSQLGFKLYFFRPFFKKKTIEDLKKIARDDQIQEKKQKLEEALLDYLKVFDAAPPTDRIIELDDTSINPKIKWDQSKDEDSVMDCISNLANLLAALRGTVDTSYSKTRKSTKVNTNDNRNGENNNETDDDISESFIQTEQINYEVEQSVTEDAARATIQLRNLALGNAISQGRNYLTRDDARLVIKVCFSTTKRNRAKLINLLLENNGELTTSQITNGLEISRPTILQTIQEFNALKIANVSTISSYENSERKIKLNDEYNWFLTEEFKQLYKPTITILPLEVSSGSRQAVCSNLNSYYTQQIITKTLSNNFRACDAENDNSCHMIKANFNHKEDENISNETNLAQQINTNRTVETNENSLISLNNNSINADNSRKDGSLNENDNSFLPSNKQKEKNSPLMDEKYFMRVTLSQESCHMEKEDHYTTKKQLVPTDVIEEILKVIRDENGVISLGYALHSACQRSEVVKEYFKNEKKLTQRDSRAVRDLFVEINRHPKIEVVKRKPELVVKWIGKEEVVVHN